MACHGMTTVFFDALARCSDVRTAPHFRPMLSPVAGRMGFPVYEEVQGYPCRCHKERQTLPISVTSRARTPKEPATNRQKGARFIARQCVIRRARCRESGPPCSRGALRSNAPDPPVRNASILPHGSCPGTETGRPGNTFGGLAIRPSRGKMTWF